MYIKSSNVIKAKCFIAMYKVSKNEISRNFGPLIEHGLHCLNFSILTFISGKNKYSRCSYKICNKFISFDMRKKKEI
jgi:hypothetical protein